MLESWIDVADRGTASLARGRVIGCTEPGIVAVHAELSGEPAAEIACILLVTSESGPPLLAPDDEVVVWAPPSGPAIVLGRIGPSRATPAEHDETPDTLTIEARQSLTLRVGAGSITIREDGKILISGKDLVSHAQRTNRIRGGAVAIN